MPHLLCVCVIEWGPTPWWSPDQKGVYTCVPACGPPGLKMALGRSRGARREWGAVGGWDHHAQGAGAGGGAEGQQVMGWFNLEQCVTSQPLRHLTVGSERCSSQKCCSYVCIFMYTYDLYQYSLSFIIIITHDLSPVTSSNTPAPLMTSWLLYILGLITSLFFNTVTDEDLCGWNVLHYHPFKLLRDCSTIILCIFKYTLPPKLEQCVTLQPLL